MSTAAAATAGLYGLALYAGHHVGDYWVQTDHEAAHKGDKGLQGVLACLSHVATYWTTQGLCVMLAAWATGLSLHAGPLAPWGPGSPFWPLRTTRPTAASTG